MQNIIITGGAVFIGSHVVRLFVNKYPDVHLAYIDSTREQFYCFNK